MPGSVAREFQPDDLAELVVLQRCCWVPALLNRTLDVPALTESHQEVLDWTRSWSTVVVRDASGRLVAAGRGRVENRTDWQVGRLMVAPDPPAGDRQRPDQAGGITRSPPGAPLCAVHRWTQRGNIAFYRRAGYGVDGSGAPIPPGHIAGAVLLTRTRWSRTYKEWPRCGCTALAAATQEGLPQLHPPTLAFAIQRRVAVDLGDRVAVPSESTSTLIES